MVKAMRKKITETIIVACLGIILGFSGFAHSQKSFFIWTDGYVAGAADETLYISFTFLTPDRNLEQTLESIVQRMQSGKIARNFQELLISASPMHL